MYQIQKYSRKLILISIKDEHLYFLSGYIDNLKIIKDLIHKFISESIYEDKIRNDINSKYLQNFSNSSLELYNKGKQLFDE